MHAWDKFIEAQEAELGSETVHKWLKTLKVLRFDAGNLYLEAQDAFQALWFEEHIRSKLYAKLLNNNNRRIKVHLTVANAPAKTKRHSKNSTNAGPEAPLFSLTFDELDPYSLFKHFVVAEANLLTHKVVAQASQSDQEAGVEGLTPSIKAFNPIYIHGSSGSGKTHLLMAAAAALKERGLHVVYTRAQTFTDHVVSAIRAGEMSTFRQTYRNSDVLIIDDVHVFSRKGATQEEFFHTFNALHLGGKQIILSANCAPGELQLIEPRLVSRFEWGIVLSLETPGREDLLKILQAKSEAMQYPIHSKVVEFLLESFSSSKSLCRAFEALILRSHLNHGQIKSTQITITMARQLLSDLLVEEEKATLTPSAIMQGAAEFFGIRPEDISGRSQTRDCVLPRQISMHLCRCQLKMPYVKIGDLFDKDHSTVMSSVKLIQKGIDEDDKEIASAYRVILKKLKP